MLTTGLFSVENAQNRGVNVVYTQGPLTATIQYGDGFDTGVWNILQTSAAYNFNSENVLTAFAATNLNHTGLAARAYGYGGAIGSNYAGVPYSQMTVGGYGANFINSTMFGAYYSYTNGSLNLVPEIQYVYAKPDQRVGLDKFSSNLGLAAFADYSFANTPYSVGAWGEYFSSNGPDTWFVNPGAQGFGVSVSPTWQGKNLFVRGDLGLLHLTKSSTGGAGGYGAAGGNRNQADFLLETGMLF
jgi:hypothetical protein